MMLTLIYFIKSWFIGLAIAAIVGPISMFFIRKTLELGFIGAVSVGLGACLGDLIYAVIAVTGITVLSSFLLENAFIIKIIGGIFLIYLGIKEIRNKASASDSIISHRKQFLKLSTQTMFLTLTSPLTIMTFIGVFASIGGTIVTVQDSIIMVVGVFLGSMTWWMILGKIITTTKKYLSKAWVDRIRYLSAIILLGFGMIALISGLLS